MRRVLRLAFSAVPVQQRHFRLESSSRNPTFSWRHSAEVTSRTRKSCWKRRCPPFSPSPSCSGRRISTAMNHFRFRWIRSTGSSTSDRYDSECRPCIQQLELGSSSSSRSPGHSLASGEVHMEKRAFQQLWKPRNSGSVRRFPIVSCTAIAIVLDLIWAGSRSTGCSPTDRKWNSISGDRHRIFDRYLSDVPPPRRYSGSPASSILFGDFGTKFWPGK